MAVSVIVHVTVLVPLLLMAMTNVSAPSTERTPEPEEDVASRERMPEEPEPALGIDEGTPSSVSWVGYEEYEEHLAQLAEVEQAAFTREPSGAMGTNEGLMPIENVSQPMVMAPPVAEETLADRADHAGDDRTEPDAEVEKDVIDADADEEITAPKDERDVQQPEPIPPHVKPSEESATLEEQSSKPDADAPALTDEDVIEGPPEPSKEVGAADEPGAHDTEAAEAPSETVDDMAVAEPDEVEVEEAIDATKQNAGASEETDDPDPENTTEESESRDAPDQSEAEHEPPQPDQRDGPPGEVRDGEEADKDADATSIIDVPRENWRLGKPLAAKGVEVKPERPHFTLLQLMTSSPRNPVVGIRFNQKGVPREAVLLRSTGDRSIDAAIVASLYRWRASGETIDELNDDQTFDLQIRIMLVQERRSG